MNLGTAKTKAIKLINEYSNNGSLITTDKNLDYTLRMNALADDVQNEISDKVGIEATYTIDSNVTPDETNDVYKKYTLPTNYKEHRFVRVNDEPFYDYRIENRQFIVNNAYTYDFVLSYYKYPTTIDDDTLDTYEFEVDDYTHNMIPYYLGGMVSADEADKEGISIKLLNIYYEKLAKAVKRTLTYPKSVRLKTRW